MMFKFSLLICLVILSFTSIAQRLDYAKDIPVKRLRVIPEHIRGGEVATHIEDLRFIPLQGTKAAIIERLKSILFFPDRIIALSYAEVDLYIYDANGKLLKHITEIEGFRPKDKLNGFYGMYRDQDTILLFGEKLRAKMDRNGNIFEKDLDFVVKDSTFSLHLQGAKFTHSAPFPKGQHMAEFALKRGDQPLISYDRRDTLKAGYFTGYPMVAASDSLAFAVFPVAYKFFELNPKGINCVHEFVFPMKNTLDTGSYHIFKNQQTLSDFVINNPEKIHAIGNLMPHRQYMVLSLNTCYNNIWIAYDMGKGEVLGLKDILPDASVDFIEFIDRKVESDGEYLYSIIYADNIKKASEKMRKEGLVMSEQSAALMKATNPIVVRFKLR